MFQVLCLKCVFLSGSSMFLVNIFLSYSDLFLKFLSGTSQCSGLSDMHVCSARADIITFLSFTAFLRSFSRCPIRLSGLAYVCLCMGN